MMLIKLVFKEFLEKIKILVFVFRKFNIKMYKVLLVWCMIIILKFKNIDFYYIVFLGKYFKKFLL